MPGDEFFISVVQGIKQILFWLFLSNLGRPSYPRKHREGVRNNGFSLRQVCLSGFKEVKEPLEQKQMCLACLSLCLPLAEVSCEPHGGLFLLHSALPIIEKEMFKNVWDLQRQQQHFQYSRLACVSCLQQLRVSLLPYDVALFDLLSASGPHISPVLSLIPWDTKAKSQSWYISTWCGL